MIVEGLMAFEMLQGQVIESLFQRSAAEGIESRKGENALS